MGLQNSVGVLLSQTVAGSADLNGSTYRIDGQNNNLSNASFSVLFHATITGGTSPTLDAYIDSSSDGTNWVQVANMTQLTSGSRNERAALNWMGPYVRARVDAGGTAAPNWTGRVVLIGDGVFTLTAV